MRRAIFAVLSGTALAVASTAANAAVTIGATGSTCTGTGCSAGVVTAFATDNIGIPNKIEFDTTNASGSVQSFFNFSENAYNSIGIFTVGAATLPNSTISLVELLTGSPLSVIQSAGPSPNTITFTTGTLTAGVPYQFRYTVALGSPGDISGNASFYPAPVPEPATWGMMLLGFAGIGMWMSRTRRRGALAQVA